MTEFSSPYPGLRPFEADEANLFFGREEQVDELLRRLHSTRFLAVVGPSGCGKSSLVRAGMLAALESGFLVSAGSDWRFAVMRPGGRPMTELSTALVEQTSLASDDVDKLTSIGLLGATLRRGPLGLAEALRDTPLPKNTNLLLLVDQFEEIFRFRREGGLDEADAFIALLLESARQREVPIYIVLTMRSDFFGDCAAFSGLPEVLNRSQYLTPRLSRDQRRAAIAGPARVFGGDVAPELVNRLLNEMGNDPDQLPLMQHLLMRMWTWRAPAQEGRRHVLTLEDYEAVGGLRHALSNHANEAFDRLDERKQSIAETLFRRLTERAPGSRDIRRPTAAGEVADLANATLAELTEVVDVFRAPGCSFVVPPWPHPLDSGTILDITHEALIRQWDRLRAWAEAEAESSERYRFLEHNAQLWKQGHMALWGTPNLEMALEWRTRIKPSELWASSYGGDYQLAMQFLDASAQARAAEEQAQREQRQRQVRRLRRVTMASVAAALFCIGVLGSVYWFGYAEHVAYYRDYIKRWGEPVGIGALDTNAVHHRSYSLKFIQRGIHYDPQSFWRFAYTVNEIQAVDADDACTPGNSIKTYLSESDEDFSVSHECLWRFVRDATSGRIVYENAYDKNGSMRWGYEYLPGEGDRNHRQGYYVGPNGSLAAFPNSPASVIRLTYSELGYEIRDAYFDRDGNPQPGPDHAYGRKFEYDADGRQISVTSLDAAGNNLNDTAGNATFAMAYDSAGNIVDAWALDAAGKPTLLKKQGFHEYRLTYDQYGNSVAEAHFDNDGHPALDESGVYETRSTRDDKGNIRRYESFDRQGNPATSSDGYHRVDVAAIGPYGQWAQLDYFDVLGRKTTDKDGGYRLVRTFDADGRELTRKAFDTDLRSVAAIEGCYEIRYTYDQDGRIGSNSCFGKNGEKALGSLASHKTIFRHDDRGNIIDRRYYGTDDASITIDKGYHHWTAKYDLFGNTVEAAYFDLYDRPVNSTQGHQRNLATYDVRGNQKSLSYFDADGALVAGPEGFARRTSAYDDRDNNTEQAYYDLNEDLTETSKEAKGYAVVRRKYDDMHRKTEIAYFDRYGNPINLSFGYATRRFSYTGEFMDERDFDAAGHASLSLGCPVVRQTIGNTMGRTMDMVCLDASLHRMNDDDGVSIVRTKYDDHGNELEIADLDMNEKPVIGPDGVAFIRASYDGAGRTIEKSFFDVDDKPMPGPNGAASIRYGYDRIGHQVEESYYQPDGKPFINNKGYSSARTRFDEHGREVEDAYFGADGAPVTIQQGYQRIAARYDARGNIIERKFYDHSNRLIVLPEQHYAIRRTQFDDHGRITEEAFFGPNEEPIVITDGYYRLSQRYDDRGNVVETIYYGTDDKPILQPDKGYAIHRATYDSSGRLTEEQYLGADGKPSALAAGYYRRVLQYPDNASGVELSFYNTDDQLAPSNEEGFAMVRSEQVLYSTNGRLIAHCTGGSITFSGASAHCLDADGHPVAPHVLITAVSPNSQAQSVGVREGDVVMTYDGHEVASPNALIRLVSDSTGGPRDLVIRRNGRNVAFVVQPGLLGISITEEFVSDIASPSDPSGK